MPALFGVGKPKTLQAEGGDDSPSNGAIIEAFDGVLRWLGGLLASRSALRRFSAIEDGAPAGYLPRRPATLAA